MRKIEAWKTSDNVVNHAIASGKLVRPDTCESCKEKKFVEAHHEDYNRPFKIDWVCKECHTQLHTKEKSCS